MTDSNYMKRNRILFVENDFKLYMKWQKSKLNRSKFIKKYQKEIDREINKTRL